MSTVKFGKRIVGDGEACFITFEAGPTHNGLESAKRLVKLAAEAKADAVKFQILDPERLVGDRKQRFTYDVLVDRASNTTETVSEPLYDIFSRRSLERHEWHALKKYSDTLGLAFFATVGFDDEIDFLDELGCDSIKIASADVNHSPLIRRAAKTGMCIQLDTGKSSIGEIETAVDIVRSEGNENIIIHHCPSGYPARLESINLNVIPSLKRIFPYPIAFSDHTVGANMDIAAVALGANLVEKTITEDRMTRSVEHVMSLEPDEMKGFVDTIQALEIALGSERRVLHLEEKKNRIAHRRSVFLKEGIEQGVRLGDCAVEFRRPGFGIPPDRYEELLNAKIIRDLPKGHCLALSDLLWDGA